MAPDASTFAAIDEFLSVAKRLYWKLGKREDLDILRLTANELIKLLFQ